MRMLPILIDLLLLGLVVALVVSLIRSFSKPTIKARDRFTAIGETSGRTIEEITRELGPPTNVQSLDANTIVLTWSDPSEKDGYHFEMQFRDGRSLGYTYVDGS
jgi:hypothetical protein